ncbi:MAG: hypothetical protein AB7H80_16330, partial [Candidatus Kapaibacterium sp.]
MNKRCFPAILFWSVASVLCPLLSLGQESLEDTTSPAISYRLVCGRQVVEVTAADSTLNDLGLASLSLDQTASVNATVEGENSTLNGSPTHRVIISLQDQQRSGLAGVIAEDLAGNRDTLQLELGLTLPELSPAPLEL